MTPPQMEMNTAGLQSSQSDREFSQALAAVSLRCVECAALYPGVEAPPRQPRYRCDCGGGLDVGVVYQHPSQEILALQVGYDALATADSDLMPLSGAAWRQLFDERASLPPLWPMDAYTSLLDASGVWRYRELILPLPNQYVVSRPEGNTALYPVGIENCGDG